MAKAKKETPSWRFSSRTHPGYEREGVLVAYWEAYLDPISDDYTPREIGARDLFDQWCKRVYQKFPNGLVPISWFVRCEEQGVLEGMPFQFEHFPNSFPHDFLTFFTWPINTATGEPLNWLTLPVADKLWNRDRANKGGFIQEATRWKPAILQPYVYLPSLTRALQEY